MNARLLFLGVVLLLSAPASAGEDVCDTRQIPQPIRDLLSEHFPDWAIVRNSDLIEEDRKLWERERPVSCAGIARGHFQDPTTLSYALYMKRKKGAHTEWTLIVASNYGGKYQHWVLERPYVFDGRASAVWTGAPGKLSAFDSSRTVTVKLDVVVFEYLESAATCYYWRRGRFYSIQTSD